MRLRVFGVTDQMREVVSWSQLAPIRGTICALICLLSKQSGAAPMRCLHFVSATLAVSAFVALAAAPANAQAPRPGQAPPPPGAQRGPAPPPPPQAQKQAPPKPYKVIPVTLAQPSNDPSFEAFRKQLADIAKRKDRAALARIVVANNFFWMGEK